MSNSILKSLDHLWQHQLINTSLWRHVVDKIIFRNTEKLKQRENSWSALLTYQIRERLKEGGDLISSCVCCPLLAHNSLTHPLTKYLWSDSLSAGAILDTALLYILCNCLSIIPSVLRMYYNSCYVSFLYASLVFMIYF